MAAVEMTQTIIAFGWPSDIVVFIYFNHGMIAFLPQINTIFFLTFKIHSLEKKV